MHTPIVETGIPVPSSSALPWASLAPGNSFLVHVPATDDPARVRARLSRLACYHARRNRMRYRVRTVEDGVRVWRVDGPVAS